MTLSEAKADLPALLNVLGIDRAGNHGPCRFCEDRTAMSVFEGESGWRFKCHRCGEKGDVFSAVMLADGVTFPEAQKRLGVEGEKTPRPKLKPTVREPVPLIPDKQRLHELVECGLLNLGKPEAVPWLKKRKITADICRRYVVGFMPSLTFDKWPGWDLGPCWLICVHDAEGNTRAVKLHRENTPMGKAKCVWAPFGEDGRHGYAELWPPPEAFDKKEKLYFCPGELKALVYLRHGHAATSPTAGESFKWTPGTVARMAGRTVRPTFDDDPGGWKLPDTTKAALKGHARLLEPMTFGKKETTRYVG